MRCNMVGNRARQGYFEPFIIPRYITQYAVLPILFTNINITNFRQKK